MDPDIIKNLSNNIDPTILQTLIKNIDPKVLENLIKNKSNKNNNDLNNNDLNNDSNNDLNNEHNTNKYKIGTIVIIKNLKNKLFNDKLGRVIAFNKENKRYNIIIDKTEKIISIMEYNLFNTD